jgi:long-chain acyl-CoA synthetase
MYLIQLPTHFQLVVERICKGIKEKVAESGPIKELLFNYFYNYKVGWKRLGYTTPLVDKVFFSKITTLVGGRIRYLVVGGAPLAPQTQEFISTCLCCPVSIGYGMTESAATGAMTFGKHHGRP